MAADESHDDKTQSFVALTEGTKVSHYEIIKKVGAGGMGEVYLAEDTQLDRKVALKFLSAYLCQDDNCRARFKREAQAAAKLSHPNIVHVYEVSEYRGRPFFVMENVEGLPLKEFSSGIDLAIAQVIEVAIQICEGLHAAHEKGITHRDIKPSNILIDSHGRAKIVDFGLASVAGKDQLTKTGSTLGTIGYMSPEQVQGQKVDQRSDLFSLGVVLYELITRQNPFKRDSEAATLKAVSEDTPHPLARYHSGIPDGLQRIIDKALEKNVTTRYQHADEILADLHRERAALSQPPRNSQKIVTWGHRSGWVKGLALSTTVVLILTILWLVGRQTPRNVVPNSTQVTFAGDVISCALSPDGTYLAYAQGTMMDHVRVMVRDISGGGSLQVFEAEAVYSLHWSPDGSELLITGWDNSRDGIFLISRFGGTPRAYPIPPGKDICWLSDEARFAVLYGSEIMLVDKKTGMTSSIPINHFPGKAQSIDWSPINSLFLISSLDTLGYVLWRLNIDGSKSTRLFDAPSIHSPQWSPDAKAIYYTEARKRASALMKLLLGSDGAVKGEPAEVLLSGLQGQKNAQISFSVDAKKMLYVQQQSWSNLWLFDPGQNNSTADDRTLRLTSGTSLITGPAISPDDKRVAFSRSLGGETHLFTMPINGGEERRLTYTSRSNLSPAWSPDGSRIAYKSSVDGVYILALINAEGGTPEEVGECTVNEHQIMEIVWSPDGQILYYPSNSDIPLFWDPLLAKKRHIDNLHGTILAPRFSRDGLRIAVFRTASVDQGIWASLIGDSAWTFLARGNMLHPLGWSPDGQWVYFLEWETNTICRVSWPGGTVDTVAKLPFENVNWIVRTSDGNQYVCEVLESKSDVWMIENFDPDSR
jgi:Tol biopolymer transport system component/predicted Ser/Thr protein kinase